MNQATRLEIATNALFIALVDFNAEASLNPKAMDRIGDAKLAHIAHMLAQAGDHLGDYADRTRPGGEA
jgi:hypothetical protein